MLWNVCELQQRTKRRLLFLHLIIIRLGDMMTSWQDKRAVNHKFVFWKDIHEAKTQLCQLLGKTALNLEPILFYKIKAHRRIGWSGGSAGRVTLWIFFLLSLHVSRSLRRPLSPLWLVQSMILLSWLTPFILGVHWESYELSVCPRISSYIII